VSTPISGILVVATVVFAAVVGPGSKGYADMGPVWSPRGDLIAFWRQGASGAEGESGMYVVSSSGGEPRRVVADRTAREPSWSPIGSALAYVSGRAGGLVGVVNVDGSGRQTLSGTLEGQLSSPMWSPDGTRIAFHRLAYRRGELWVVRRNGEQLRRVATDVPYHHGSEPTPYAWSPDGTRLVYSAVRSGRRDLWTVHPEGNRTQRLLRTLVSDWAPTWSPDGTKIAFTGPERAAPTLYIADIPGRKLEVVGSGRRPRWNPAAQQLAFIGTTSGVGIYLITPQRTATKLFASPRGTSAAQWSPAGDHIAVAAYGDCTTRGTGIYAVAMNGDTRRITNPCAK
jgi:Tol biopolymer transport system component